MKTSKFYQRWLQVVSRSSIACLFFSGYYLNKERYDIAIGLLVFQLITGYIISELMYRRQNSVVREESNKQEGTDGSTNASK